MVRSFIGWCLYKIGEGALLVDFGWLYQSAMLTSFWVCPEDWNENSKEGDEEEDG